MNHIETKVLTAVIGLIGSFSVWFMKDISTNTRELNIKVATLIEKNSSFEKRVDRIETTIYGGLQK